MWPPKEGGEIWRASPVLYFDRQLTPSCGRLCRIFRRFPQRGGPQHVIDFGTATSLRLISNWTFMLAERYERGSVLLTSNCRSQVGGASQGPMTTAQPSIDSCTLRHPGLNIPSYRMEQAKKNRDSATDTGEPVEYPRQSALVVTGRLSAPPLRGYATTLPATRKPWNRKAVSHQYREI